MTSVTFGSCQSEAIVSSAPLPVAAVDTPQEFSFAILPSELQRVSFYQAKLQDAGGNLTPAPGHGQYPTCPVPGVECLAVCAEQCWADCGTNVYLSVDRTTREGYLMATYR